MQNFTFRTESDGYGWVKVKIAAGSQDVTFYASYLRSYPLRDALKTLRYILSRDKEEPAYHEPEYMEWESEPGCLVVSLQILEDDNLLVRVKENAHGNSWHISETTWETKLETVLPLAEYKDIIIKEAERNLVLHGLVGMEDDWMSGPDVFPLNTYLALKGIRSTEGPDQLKTSSLVEELKILNSLLESKDD